MIAFAIYIYNKYKINSKFMNTDKGISNNEIFLTYLIHIIFVKIIIVCLVCILYISLDNKIFNLIIPFILIPKLAVLLGSYDIFGSVSVYKTPVFHLMENEMEKEMEKDTDTDMDMDTDTNTARNIAMPNIWQDFNSYLLNSTYKNSKCLLDQTLIFNSAWNSATVSKQFSLQPNGQLGAAEECFIWEDWNSSKEQENFNRKNIFVMSCFLIINFFKHISIEMI